LIFGAEQLRNIKAEMVQRYVNASDGSPKSIKNRISLLMVMWDMARTWEYVQHNPFPRGTNGRLLIKLPQAVKGKTYSFTVEETLAIIDRARGWKKLLFRILAETGMRPGEGAGLLREKCRLTSLSIAQSIWQQEVQTPKTENAIRTFAISEQLGTDIQQYIAESGPNAYGLLFVTDPGRKRNSGGKPLSMDNFRNRVLNPVLDELGIRAKIKERGVRGGNYAFRHMNATVMDGLHTPLKTQQKRLGHADIATTLIHYTHAVDADDLAAADALGALLNPKGTPPAESPETVPPDILAHPAIQAEISRQVALALGRQP
jgi:integrase